MNILRLNVLRTRLSLLLAAVLLLAACGPAPLGTSWPAVSLLPTTCGETTQTNVMVAYNDRIVLVNAADGTATKLLNSECEPRPAETDGKPKVWEFRPATAQQFFMTPLLLDDETLLTTTYTQRIFTVDMAAARSDSNEGSTIAGYNGHTVADPLINGDLLYIGLSSKDLVALDKNSYVVQWKVETGHGVWAKPLLVDDTLYFPSLDHNLYAVNAQTGELKWKLDLGGASAATPIYHNGLLYTGSLARKIYAISPEGSIVAQYDTADWVWGTPVIVDDVLYAADLVGNVYALDVQQDLAQIWKIKAAERAIRATPIVTDQYVIVGSRDHRLYWLNKADGSQALDTEGQPMRRELTSEILSNMLLVEPSATLDIPEPYIIVSTLSTGELLVAYTVERGQFVWKYAYS